MRSAILALMLCAACGDDLALPPLTGTIDQRLAQLPGVTVTEILPDARNQLNPAYRYFDLAFTQTIDHGDRERGAFPQRAALIHRDDDAPLVVLVGGYDTYLPRRFSEPAALAQANQLSLEYRFYGDSHGDPTPWELLDVAQAQADQHAIVQDLARVYANPHRIVTGGSKGGENALQSMRLYPDDYDGAIAYVAPVITDKPDLRYAHVLDDIGVAECRDRLRAVQRELLARRAMVEARASAADGTRFDHAGLGKAVETAIVELEFAYWMELGPGAPACSQIPTPQATDDQLYAFLDTWSSPLAYADHDLSVYGQQYIYQDQTELGYPIWEHAHLDDLLQYSYEDWSRMMPIGARVPAYDPSVPRDLAAWVEQDAEHVMLVGGEWDPWGAGYPARVPDGRDAYRFTVAHGSHWSSGIYSLAPADLPIAFDTVARWSGASATQMRALPPELVPSQRAPGVRAPAPRGVW